MKSYFLLKIFKGKSMQYIEDAAENWALGFKLLESEYH